MREEQGRSGHAQHTNSKQVMSWLVRHTCTHTDAAPASPHLQEAACANKMWARRGDRDNTATERTAMNTVAPYPHYSQVPQLHGGRHDVAFHCDECNCLRGQRGGAQRGGDGMDGAPSHSNTTAGGAGSAAARVGDALAPQTPLQTLCASECMHVRPRSRGRTPLTHSQNAYAHTPGMSLFHGGNTRPVRCRGVPRSMTSLPSAVRLCP